MTVRCSVASEQRGEPLAGTASTVRHFLLLEDPGPWGPEILRSQRLPGPVREPLLHWHRELGVRPLLIRRPGRYLTGPRRVFVINARYGWCETTTVDNLAEVAQFDLDGIVGGAGVGLSAHHEPVLLVCTHGRHDACCAERGRPLAAAIAARWPDITWESSHLGGDRFAATFKGDIAHLTRVNTGIAGQQGGFHPVLATDRRPGTDHHFIRIVLHGFQQIPKVFVR